MTKMTKCKSCSKEIATNAKSCPNCGAKNKKPIYKRPWFIIVAFFLIIGVIGDSNDGNSTTIDTETAEVVQTTNENKDTEESIQTEDKVEEDNTEVETEEEEEVYTEQEVYAEEEEEVYTDTIKEIADSIISRELYNNLTNTTLDLLRVNENMGTDSEEDVIVLADLSWSTKNLEKTTREMIEMYSDHLAANLAEELADGSEIALFWDAEYTGLSIKHSYYVENGNAYSQE